MELDKATDGMMQARADFRTRQGIEDPEYISRCMQRLAQFTAAVEVHLGEMEERIEVEEAQSFIQYTKDGLSPNQASLLARQDVGKLKGQIAKLKRYCNGSWQIVSVSQSRINHLSKQSAGQI